MLMRAILIISILLVSVVIAELRIVKHRERILELERRNRTLAQLLTVTIQENHRLINENQQLRTRPPIRLPDLSWSTISRN